MSIRTPPMDFVRMSDALWEKHTLWNVKIKYRLNEVHIKVGILSEENFPVENGKINHCFYVMFEKKFIRILNNV